MRETSRSLGESGRLATIFDGRRGAQAKGSLIMDMDSSWHVGEGNDVDVIGGVL